MCDTCVCVCDPGLDCGGRVGTPRTGREEKETYLSVYIYILSLYIYTDWTVRARLNNEDRERREGDLSLCMYIYTLSLCIYIYRLDCEGRVGTPRTGNGVRESEREGGRQGGRQGGRERLWERQGGKGGSGLEMGREGGAES